MDLSLIIPVYNERAAIERCLTNLEALEGPVEVIFADGGSADGTVEATGNVLWFSHCDSLLPADGPEQIRRAVEAGVVFGCFTIAFDYDGPFMGCNTFLSNFRSRRWHIAFGDQGIFVRRDLFQDMGGFPDLPLMEDYEFSRRMKARKIPLTVLPGQIVTSARRYRQGSPLVTMAKMFCLRCLYRAGVNIEKIARLYQDVR